MTTDRPSENCLHLAEMTIGKSGRTNEYGRKSLIVECLMCGALRLDDEMVHKTDRPSAATPEEVLDAMLAETFTAGARDDFRNGYELDFSRQEVLDLGRRYMDAAYEDAARVVEGTGSLAYPEETRFYRATLVKLIRALIGGGE